MSLEIDEKMQNEPFHVSGTLNAPNMTTAIQFYEGRLLFLMGFTELIRKDKQAHYFKEMPELISDQYVFIHPTQTDGRSHLSFDLHLEVGIRWVVSTENIRNESYPFSAVGLVMDGNLQQISQGFNVWIMV